MWQLVASWQAAYELLLIYAFVTSSFSVVKTEMKFIYVCHVHGSIKCIDPLFVDKQCICALSHIVAVFNYL